MAKEKHYIEMTASECRLAYVALMQFRNDIIQRPHRKVIVSFLG